MKKLRIPVVLLVGLAVYLPTTLFANGARLFKSGPIQITADGAYVWIANPATDSISRIETATDTVVEIPIPDTTLRHQPLGLSVREDGSEVWVACHDSDRVYVFNGSGALLRRIDLPWGSGPHSVALSRDQSRALVTLHRSASLAVIDTAAMVVTDTLAPLYWSPLGIAWMEDGVSAWVTHLFADGEDPFLTRVDFSGASPKVTARIIVKSTNPKQSNGSAGGIAEGGYLTFRGHLAQIPSATGRNELWLPTQYNNINDNSFSPDSTVQTTIRRLDLSTDLIPNTNNDKVILTARLVHDPAACGVPLVGPGWDAHISGPVDIAFSTDGQMVVVVAEQSNDLVVLRHDTPANQNAGFQVTEIRVGWKPMGVAVSPTQNVAYVMNELSRSVSVVNLTTLTAVRQIVVTTEPLTPALLNGARIFHTSVDPTNRFRISSNEKVACASCHPNGEHDGRVWNFESLPGQHGPRSTMNLLNLSETIGPVDPATGFGQLHRSGDRDEIEDFDHTFQGVQMGGTGFLGAGVCAELDPVCLNATRGSTDLNQLAAYLRSLRPVARSPYRRADGSLTDAAVRGATFFKGTSPTQPADGSCVTCHVPSTGFVDFKFHDVGQRRDPSENELNNRTPPWSVNTATLRGIWTSPPYDGVATFASSLVGVINDVAGRTTHGRTAGLTGRQRADLAELLGSIDGNMSATEITTARDVTAPHIIRVEPASLTRVNVWFDETVDAISAARPSAYEIEKVSDGSLIPITAATWDPQNGDRVALTVQLQATCGAGDYILRPGAGTFAIVDAADTASGGFANPLDLLDPANTHRFGVSNVMTITLGASGYESITVPVHDAAMVSPSLGNWSHDSVWLYRGQTGCGGGVVPFTNKGFVRFGWSNLFSAVTGITSPADIIDASFSLSPEWGDAQAVVARRMLKPWSDAANGGDWNSNAPCAPTWQQFARPGSCPHPTGNWTQAGGTATAAGVDGQSVSDYNASNDVGFTPDVTLSMDAINTRQSFAGPMVTDALRFWLQNPQVDYGYALELSGTTGRQPEVKFDRVESEFRQHGPVLTVAYRLSAVSTAPGEVSGGATPLLAIKQPAGDVRFSFEDLGPVATAYNVYEGTIGNYYSHAGAQCGAMPGVGVGGRREVAHTPAAGSRYFIVTASNTCAEGPSDPAHPVVLHDCLP